MVYYYKSVEPKDEYDFTDAVVRKIYMGKDKHENVPLIKYSQPNYIWFHVDNFSSAHVYIETTLEEQKIAFEKLTIPEYLLNDVAQLTKANSIKANKINNVTIIYTPVSNLHTDGTMDDGTVTFKNQKQVRKVFVAKKDNSVINRLNKTKTEGTTQEFIEKQSELKVQYERQMKEEKRRQDEQKKQWAIEKKLASQPYAQQVNEDDVDSAYRQEGFNWEEDFM